MLKRILDTEGIDMENETIQGELAIDLERMDLMKHDAPKKANAYKVIVEPSLVTYDEHFHRFRFEIQYGILKKDKFNPIGESIRTQSEALPFLS